MNSVDRSRWFCANREPLLDMLVQALESLNWVVSVEEKDSGFLSAHWRSRECSLQCTATVVNLRDGTSQCLMSVFVIEEMNK